MKNKFNTATFLRQLTLTLIVAMLAAAFQTARAQDSYPEYITEVIVVGGSKDETNTAKKTYEEKGYTFCEKDLNAGCGSSSDYIYLGYKTESRANTNGGYITDFVVIKGSNPPATISYNGRTYSLCPYDGGDHFKEIKGNLNSNVSSGWDLYLYYTKDNYDKRAVNSITFNNIKSGAVDLTENGSGGIDLNAGCGEDTDYIYMHITTTPKSNRPSNDPVMASGLTYNGDPQALLTIDNTNTGTMMYRVGESGDFSSSIPTATNAGNYTVYYYADADGYGNKSETKSKTVSIAKLWDQDANGNYLITSVADLNALSTLVNSGHDCSEMSFKVTQDINFNPSSSTNNNFTAIGNSSNRFNGHFDGNDKIISGIRINSTDKYQGLFGYLDEQAVVEKITLANTNITGASYTGGIAGYNYYGTLKNNLVINTTISSSSNYGVILGVGYMNTFKNNYYRNCKVGNTENATNVGCKGEDITYNNSAVSIHTITLCSGITISTSPSITYDGTKYYAQGTVLTLSYTSGKHFLANNVKIDGTTYTMPAKDVTFTPYYFVNYTLNNGTLPSGTANPTIYTSGTLTLPTPTRDYYTFDGWYQGNTKKTSISGITADVTLTAKWTPVEYKITYTLNDGSLPDGTANPTSYTVESDKITLPTPTRDYYTFSGWYDNKDFNGDPITSIDPTATHANVTLYAKWTPIEYKITYYPNGGSLPDGIANPTTYTVESDITLPTPTRDGYDFGGWYGNEDFEGDKITSIDPAATHTNVELYAKWTLAEYKITYTLNGGTLPDGTANPTTYTIESDEITLPTPTTREYATFGGWYVYNNFTGDPITSIDPTATHANVELYAKWDFLTITEIYTTDDLITFSNTVNAGNRYLGITVTLMNDIDFNPTDETTKNFTAIGTEDHPFYGTFDGQGHTISGIRINTESYYQGLFGRNASSATVKNLTIDNAVITSSESDVGGIVGLNLGTISNCIVTNNVKLTSYNLCGGVTGSNEGTISNCVVSNDVELTANFLYCGGVVGFNSTNGSLSNNLVIGATIIENYDYHGAIVGGNNGTLQNNFYYNTTVNDVTTKVGCKGADIEDQNGAVHLDLLIDGESTESVSVAPGTYQKVLYRRNITAGIPTTIMLPFNFDASAFGGGKFYTFTGINAETWEATMTETTSTLSANTPYIYIADKNMTSVVFAGVTIEKTEAGKVEKTDWTFQGTYEKKVWNTNGEIETKNVYGFAAKAGKNQDGESYAAGEFVRARYNISIKPTRAYLQYTGNDVNLSKSALVLPDRIKVVFIDKETASVIDDPTVNPSENEDGDITTPTSEIQPTANVKVWSYDKTIFIQARPGTDYRIIDASGRTLRTAATQTDRDEIRLGSRSGIAIVIINGKIYKVIY